MSYGWFEGNHPWYFLFGSTCMVCLWLHVWEGKLYSAVDIGGGSSFAQALTPSRGRAQALGDGARPTFVHSENEQLLLRAVCPQAAEHNALLLETAWQRAFKKVVPRDHQCCGLMLRMPGGILGAWDQEKLCQGFCRNWNCYQIAWVTLSHKTRTVWHCTSCEC